MITDENTVLHYLLGEESLPDYSAILAQPTTYNLARFTGSEYSGITRGPRSGTYARHSRYVSGGGHVRYTSAAALTDLVTECNATSGTICIELFIRPVSTHATVAYAFGYGTDNTTPIRPVFRIGLLASAFVFGLHDGSSLLTSASLAAFTPGEWHLLTINCARGASTWTLNGWISTNGGTVALTERTINAPEDADANDFLHLFRYGTSGNALEGQVGDIRVTPRARTQGEAEAAWASGRLEDDTAEGDGALFLIPQDTAPSVIDSGPHEAHLQPGGFLSTAVPIAGSPYSALVSPQGRRVVPHSSTSPNTYFGPRAGTGSGTITNIYEAIRTAALGSYTIEAIAQVPDASVYGAFFAVGYEPETNNSGAAATQATLAGFGTNNAGQLRSYWEPGSDTDIETLSDALPSSFVGGTHHFAMTVEVTTTTRRVGFFWNAVQVGSYEEGVTAPSGGTLAVPRIGGNGPSAGVDLGRLPIVYEVRFSDVVRTVDELEASLQSSLLLYTDIEANQGFTLAEKQAVLSDRLDQGEPYEVVLFETMPNDLGIGGVEVSADGYERQSLTSFYDVTIEHISRRLNLTPVTFEMTEEVQTPGWGIRRVGGALVCFGLWRNEEGEAEAMVLPANEPFLIPIGAIGVGLA